MPWQSEIQINSKITNWCVFTGAPSSGKSTLTKALNKQGYYVVPEVARTFINNQLASGQTIDDLRADDVCFQNQLLQMNLSLEDELSTDKLIFLDRAVPDSIAYQRINGHHSIQDMKDARHYIYRKIFLFDPLPLIDDCIRLEHTSRQINTIDKMLYQVYTELYYNVIRVPVMSVTDRVNFVLEHILTSI